MAHGFGNIPARCGIREAGAVEFFRAFAGPWGTEVNPPRIPIHEGKGGGQLLPKPIQLRSRNPPPIQDDRGFRTFILRHIPHAEAESLGVLQPSGVVRTNQLSASFDHGVVDEIVERQHAPANAVPGFKDSDIGTGALELPSAAQPRKPCANHKHPGFFRARPAESRRRQHQGGTGAERHFDKPASRHPCGRGTGGAGDAGNACGFH